MTSIDTTRERLDAIFSTANDYEEATRKMHDEFVVIPRSELPEVVAGREPGDFRTDGQSVVFTSADNAREWVLRDVAVWQHLEALRSTAAAKRNARREELAASMVEEAYGDNGHARKYGSLSGLMKLAIDRIIELEEQAAA
jgi:hypothetical protein